MTKAKIFFYLCLAFIFGIFIDSFIAISQPLRLGILILGLIFISALWGRKKFVLAGFIIIFVAIGIWRHNFSEAKTKQGSLAECAGKSAIVLQGRVSQEPDVRDKIIKLAVESQFLFANGEKNRISGKVLLNIGRYPVYRYGDEIRIEGSLKTPANFEDFNYQNYLAQQGILVVMDWPEIELIKRDSYNNFWEKFYASILNLKSGLREAIEKNIAHPKSSLLSAMILGNQGQMPEDLRNKLNITGLRHITAISGMNVAILCGVLMSLLLGLGLSRGKAFYFSLIFISLFIVMIGFQASVVRAGIMAGIMLLAQKVGRKAEGGRAVVLAAAVMLAINPLPLVNDIGFQLSFLAIMGMIYLAPIFNDWLKFIPQERFINLRSILATTFAAQIFTLPILIYNFGRISLVAPVTNILILPIVYWIMIFGILLAISGMIFQPLAWIFLFPSWLLIAYLMKVVDLFSQPWATRTIANASLVWLIIPYFLLGGFIFWLRQKNKLKFLDY